MILQIMKDSSESKSGLTEYMESNGVYEKNGVKLSLWLWSIMTLFQKFFSRVEPKGHGEQLQID